MDNDVMPPSMITRLLEEISWEKAVRYRAGGRGMENVLTAEVLMGLDLLPRAQFFGQVVRSCLGGVNTRAVLADQAESAVMSLLPGDMPVNSGGTAGTKFIVQPDAIITTPNVFAFIEAKRIRSSSFQPEQLAREYVAVMSNAGDRIPLLFLLGVEPPVSVQGLGKLSLLDAIRMHLPAVLERAGHIGFNEMELLENIDDIVCWISWDSLASAVVSELAAFSCGDSSTEAAVRRTGQQIVRAIEWHS
jgi:hypothetical protein